IERFGLKNVRTALLSAAAPIGCLRLYSERTGGILRFDGLAYRDFIDPANFAVDRPALVRAAKNCAQRQDIPDQELLTQLSLIEAQNFNPWKICAGPDL